MGTPCADDVKHVIDCVTSEASQQCMNSRKMREQNWKDNFASEWSEGGSKCFAWCKGEQNERAEMISRPDGSLTCDSAEMDQLVRDAWLPIFQMYASSPAPSWQDFKARFGAYFVPKHEMRTDLLNGERLRRTLARMRSKSAAGCDAWRVDELKCLPVAILDRLADLFNIIEDTGAWPQALTVGTISLISKGEGASPLKLRPIGLMSVVYRLWAATRVAEVLSWQDLWLDKSLHGFRRGHGAEDVWWEQALQVEEALLHSGSLFGISLDYGKCFDRVPVHIVLNLALEAGLPPQLVTPLRSLYEKLVRRFRVGNGVGQEFKATNGIIQGCPLSVVLLNLLVNVWAQAVKAEVPGASPCGYADDTGALSSAHAPIQKVLDLTGQFAQVTGQVLNASKSHAWATNTCDQHKLASLALMGDLVPATTGGRLLGAHISYQRGVKNTLGEKRVKRGIVICERIRWAPLPMHIRSQLLASLVMPSTLYGACVGGLTMTLLNSLTSAVMRTVWGTKRKLRCKEVVLTLLVPGHVVDPTQAIVYQSMCTLRRFVSKSPDLAFVLRNCWQACVVDGGVAPGPVGLIHKAVLSIGWSWNSFEHFARPGRTPLPLCGGPDNWWQRELRDGLMLAKWGIAAEKRNDMHGIDAVQGVDTQATLALSKSGKLPPDEVGILRGIVSGSVRLQKRLYQAGIVASPICPFCHMCEETVFHCFWECPYWDALRLEFDLPCVSVRAEWPVCTSTCGIFLEDPRVMSLAIGLEQEQPILGDIDGYFRCSDCRDLIARGAESSVPQVLWTDGASSNNQDHRFRRAGSGIFYGPSHAFNYSCMLPGVAQSNQRAELFAVLLACLRDPRELDIRSDSQYVCEGVRTLHSWASAGWHGVSADLWNLLASELRARETNVCVSWVKGHAKQIDIDRGRTTREDKEGNDGADELAVAGATLHEIDSEVVDSAALRKLSAKRVQGMMVHVLKARLVEESRLSGTQAGHDSNDDRGSDAGSCMCMEVDECASDDGLDLSDTVLPFASDTEPGHYILDDECDQSTGTYSGVLQ